MIQSIIWGVVFFITIGLLIGVPLWFYNTFILISGTVKSDKVNNYINIKKFFIRLFWTSLLVSTIKLFI